MSTPPEYPGATYPPAMPASNRPNPAFRALAGVFGFLWFLVGAIGTLGTALGAPLAMAVAGWVARRRKRPLTRGVSWIVAVSGSTVACAIFFAVALSLMPGDFFK